MFSKKYSVTVTSTLANQCMRYIGHYWSKIVYIRKTRFYKKLYYFPAVSFFPFLWKICQMTGVLGQVHCILSLCKLYSCNFHSSKEILNPKKTGLLLPTNWPTDPVYSWQKYRVSHLDLIQCIWLWRIEICRLDLVWRWFGNPE